MESLQDFVSSSYTTPQHDDPVVLPACKNYEEYKFNYAAGNNAVGKAILSPYSPGSDVVTRYTNDRRSYFR